MKGVFLGCLLTACGPVAYVQQVTLDADTAVERARDAHADKLSPYYWTRATNYLHMAREVAAHADFQGANRFGKLAVEAAKQAQAEAELGQQDPSKLPYIDLSKQPEPAKVAPAKDDAAVPSKVAPAKDDK